MAGYDYKEANWGAVKHDDDQVCCRVIQDHLKKYMGYTNVYDVSLDKRWQEIDVDLVAVKNSGNRVFYEIKADDYNAIGGGKKIFLETVSNSNTGSTGCVLSSKANIFAWMFLRYNCFAAINAYALKDYVEKNKDSWGPPKKAATYKNGKLCYYSYGYVKSLEDLKAANVGYRICFLDEAACNAIEAQQARKKIKKVIFDAERNQNPVQPMPPTNTGFTVSNTSQPLPQAPPQAYTAQDQEIIEMLNKTTGLREGWEVYPATPDNCPFLDPQSA